MKQATPIDFTGLESISREERLVQDILFHLLPTQESRLKLLLALEQVLQSAIRGGCTLHHKNSQLESLEQWRERVKGEGVYVVLSTTPTGPKAVLVWDSILALALVDRLLGGELNEVPVPRILTEIESGVFSYILMKACQAFHVFFADDTLLPVRLEKIVTDMNELNTVFSDCQQIARIDLAMAIPELTGPVQLIIGDAFIKDVLGDRVSLVKEPVSEPEQKQRLQALGDLHFPMRATVGSTALSPQELAGLEPGDIVLLDQAHCRLNQGQLNGELLFYPLRPGAPKIRARIESNGPPAQMRIEEMFQEA